ncbi:MAG: peptide MFS transporter [Bacteroidota bacterium]
MNLDTNIKKEVMGHPAGLFILFFTEMWERFSYYGMRAILVLFLVSATGLGGWEWAREDALQLYAMYTLFVYITPLLGGFIADRLMGFKWAVVLGALLMTLGHASMAIETEFFFYAGLILLVLGNGFFKPNISSMVSGLYEGKEDKKDAGYTIFYMGINAGAFLGILLCGYIGEKVGWSYGFGLAGIFMLIGMLQFWFARRMFGKIGDKPLNKMEEDELPMDEVADGIDPDDILDSQTDENDEKEKQKDVKITPKVRKDRLIVLSILAFFTIFFWMAFEQAGGSMTIFANDYTDRILNGGSATAFTIVNAIIVLVPTAVLTWVLAKLFQATFKNIALSNILLGTSFVIIWGIVIWMINKDLNTHSYEIEYSAVYSETVEDEKTGEEKKVYIPVDEQTEVDGREVIDKKTTVRQDKKIEAGASIQLVDVDGQGTFRHVYGRTAEKLKTKIDATVIKEKENELEIPASWFGILNSLFIISFAPLFSKIWQSRFNPSAPVKFAFGLILLGVGFGFLAYGGLSIEQGAKTASVSIIWLILAYLFHTLGELSLSPVGLSYVSKLSPPKLLSLMFGMWFTATALANGLAGLMGSLIDYITTAYSISFFFMIFTVVPIGAGLILVFMNKWLVKKMHGIR